MGTPINQILGRGVFFRSFILFFSPPPRPTSVRGNVDQLRFYGRTTSEGNERTNERKKERSAFASSSFQLRWQRQIRRGLKRTLITDALPLPSRTFESLLARLRGPSAPIPRPLFSRCEQIRRPIKFWRTEGRILVVVGSLRISPPFNGRAGSMKR